MSIHVLSWAWKQPISNPTRKLVLLKLADAANDDGVCWPYQRTIARDVGVSTRSVERHVAALRAAELIDVEQQYREDGGKAFNVYRIVGYRPHPTPASGTPDIDVRSLPTSASGLARASDQGEPEPSKDPPPIAPPSEAVEHPAPATVDRKAVTADERFLASHILTAFNEVFDTTFHAPGHVAKIVMRIREHPELSLDQHRAIIEANARAPWWKGPPSPSVVYGNDAQFERAMLAGSERSVNLSGSEAQRVAEEEAERMRAEAEVVDADVVAEEDG